MFSDLFCVDGLHGKLPSHLVVFLGEGQIVGIGSDDVTPDRVAGCKYEHEAAPFCKPSAKNRFVGREQAVPYKGCAIDDIRQQQCAGAYRSCTEGQKGSNQQISSYSSLICDDEYGECVTFPVCDPGCCGGDTVEQREQAEHKRSGRGDAGGKPVRFAQIVLQKDRQKNEQVAGKKLQCVQRKDRKLKQYVNEPV